MLVAAAFILAGMIGMPPWRETYVANPYRTLGGLYGRGVVEPASYSTKPVGYSPIHKPPQGDVKIDMERLGIQLIGLIVGTAVLWCVLADSKTGSKTS